MSRTYAGATEAGSDLALTAPHVSNAILRSFLVYFSELEGEAFVEEAVREAGLELPYFSEPGWVSTLFVERFTEGVVRRLHGLDALPAHDHPVWQHWRAAGRINLRRDLLGPLWHVLRVMGSPALFYRRVPELVHKANNLSRVEVVSQAPGACTLAFTSADPEIPDKRYYCWNRIGFLEAAPQVWGLPPAEVEHWSCMHDPARLGDACVYRIRYAQRRVMRLVAPILGVAAGAAGGVALSMALDISPPVAMATAGGLSGVAAILWDRLATTGRAWADDAAQLASLLDQADERYQQLWDDRQNLRRALLVNRKISGYLAQDLVERILDDPEMETRLGGVRTHAAVLFADIVGFTPRCEGREPEDVVTELNLYFGEVDRVIAAHGGIIDKRMGDGLMVVFASRGQEGPDGLAQRALSCALDLLRALPGCDARLAERGFEPIRIRVGLAAGPLVLGNMGSEVKLEFTVIGEVVNLAARLESAATPGHVLVERSQFERLVQPSDLVSARSIRVKGIGAEVDVMELRPAR